MIKKFAEGGAIHGVKYIFGSDFGNFTRLFWTFSTFFSICGFFYYLYPAWMKLMFNPEILIKTYERNIEEFPWPAISICPNVFAIDSFAKLSEVNNSQIKRNEEDCKATYANLMWCSPRQINDLYKDCKKEVLYSTNVTEEILKTSLKYEELILSPSNKTPMKTTLSGYGPCYTYNSLSYSSLFNTKNIHDDFKQFIKFIGNESLFEDDSFWSAEKGLKIKNGSEIYTTSNNRKFQFALRISPENANNACFEKTVRIFIHKPNEIANKFHEYYELNYNEFRKVKLTIKSRQTDNGLREYPPESRKCYFESEKPLKFFKTYTKSNCEWECVTFETLKKCGCVFYSMPRNESMKICNNEEVKCPIGKETRDCSINCYPACNDINFEMISEFSKIKDDIYFRYNTSSDWSISIALFYNFDKTVEEVQHFLSYRTQNFISDFGGLLGLFMGCSVLSIVEVLFFLFLGFRSFLYNMCRTLYPKKINDVTWATKSMMIDVKPAAQLQHPIENHGDIIVTLNAFMRETREGFQRIEKENQQISERLLKIEMETARFAKLSERSIGTSIQSFI